MLWNKHNSIRMKNNIDSTWDLSSDDGDDKEVAAVEAQDIEDLMEQQPVQRQRQPNHTLRQLDIQSKAMMKPSRRSRAYRNARRAARQSHHHIPVQPKNGKRKIQKATTPALLFSNQLDEATGDCLVSGWTKKDLKREWTTITVAHFYEGPTICLLSMINPDNSVSFWVRCEEGFSSWSLTAHSTTTGIVTLPNTSCSDVHVIHGLPHQERFFFKITLTHNGNRM